MVGPAKCDCRRGERGNETGSTDPRAERAIACSFVASSDPPAYLHSSDGAGGWAWAEPKPLHRIVVRPHEVFRDRVERQINAPGEHHT